MPIVDRNHPIETLASGGANEAFAVCIRLRRAYRRLQHVKRRRTKGLVDGRREDAVTIMDEKAISAMQRKIVPELLDCPLRGRVLGC